MRNSINAAARSISAIVVCCALLLHVSVPALADSSEISILKKIPPTVLDHLTFDAKPDPSGAMQLNVGGWHAVAYQRIAIPLIVVGAVEGDASKVDDGWRAIDLAFSHQLSDGSFATADGSAMPPTDMSFWLEAVCHALIVVQESSLAGQYQSRIGALKPKIARALAWFEQPSVRAHLLRGDFRDDGFFASNRLIIDANAFLSASLLLADPGPMTYARQFLAQAVNRETSDGVLSENGGFDSSYQTVALLHGTYYALHDPSAPGLRDALQRGLQRELAAVDPSTGAVDVSRNTRTAGQERVAGHVKRPDYRNMILGLYYVGNYLGDSSATQAAGRIFQQVFHVDPNT